MLTREELWAGLLCRVENPEPFLPGLEACEIVERGENWVERVLDFGPAAIRDRVTIVPLVSVRFDILPGEAHAGGRLTIEIESRSEVDLFLRFTYENPMNAAPDDPQYADYLKSAYQQSDVDMVRLIREMAADGKLSKTVH